MRSTRAAAVLLGTTLALAACGSGSSDAAPGVDDVAAPASETEPAPAATAVPTSDAPAAEPVPASDEGGEPAAVPAALQFSAPLVGGGEIDAAALAGKPTVFWFWAPT